MWVKLGKLIENMKIFLASQDAVEVIGVTYSLTDSLVIS